MLLFVYYTNGSSASFRMRRSFERFCKSYVHLNAIRRSHYYSLGSAPALANALNYGCVSVRKSVGFALYARINIHHTQVARFGAGYWYISVNRTHDYPPMICIVIAMSSSAYVDALNMVMQYDDTMMPCMPKTSIQLSARQPT